MSFELTACLLTIFLLAAIGTPIAYSVILGALAYLAVAGQDIALAGEQILQGLYDSFILLAVPLFIVAANIMNAGTISERLLTFCVAAVGRFRGGLGHVNIVASLIFSGMSGSAVAKSPRTRSTKLGAPSLWEVIIDPLDTSEGRAPLRGGLGGQGN